MGNLGLPNIVNADDVTNWHDEADVIVIGLGIAGACAAIEARTAGADVLVVERASGGGGASALSGGIFYLGGGTPVQQAFEFNDDAENMYRFLMASTGCPDASVLRRFCDESAGHFAWLEAQGVPFDRTYFKNKAYIPPPGYCLCSTGNESIWPYREIARPYPRGHTVTTSDDIAAGQVAMNVLQDRCQELDVRTQFNSRVVALVRDGSGRIVGTRVKQFDGTIDLHAKKAVIVAAGGFSFNKLMVEHYLPWIPETIEPLGITSSDGDAILLGMSVGAKTQAMDAAIATGSFYPPEKLIKGIIVNLSGHRFVNEDSYHGRTGERILEQPGHKAYLILDSETFDYPDAPRQKENARRTLIDAWETIEEMETGLNLPTGSLQQTMRQYNRGAENGTDPLYNKHPKWLKPLDQSPFAAFEISPGSFSYVFLTLGGLKTTDEAEVIHTDGKIIPGLYAAGACVSSIPQNGDGYASGLSLGPGSFYGRVAGRNGAR